MSHLKTYLGNYWLWLRGFYDAHKAFAQAGTKWKARLVWYLVWALDNGLNCITGGDSRETISSAWQKDRHAVGLANFGLRLIEKFDPDHGDVAYNARYGEGTADNRELPGRIRWIIVGWWVVWVVITWRIAT